METLDNVPVGNDYTKAATLEQVWQATGGYFSVGANDVYAQVQHGPFGSPQWGSPFRVNAGSNATLGPGAIGFRFKNYVAGSVAVVSGFLTTAADPSVFIGPGSVTVADPLVLSHALYVNSSEAIILKLGRTFVNQTIRPDLQFGASDWQLNVGSGILCTEIGDVPNFVLRTAYPPSGAADQVPSAVLNGGNLGYLGWQAYNSGGGFLDSNGGNAFPVQVYARAVGDQTPANSGGRLIIRTTPTGTFNVRDTIAVEDDGTLNFLTGNMVSARAGTAAGNPLLRALVSGDSADRLEIDYDGSYKIGPGNAALESMFRRGGANILEVIAQLNTDANLLLAKAGPSLRWASASAVQATVGAAGGAAAPPATPATWLKVLDDNGNTRVIPAYNP